jgi:hypothetical protein
MVFGPVETANDDSGRVYMRAARLVERMSSGSLVRAFRVRTVTLVTTLLNAEVYPAEELASLYLRRWGVETDLAHLKTDRSRISLPTSESAGRRGLTGGSPRPHRRESPGQGSIAAPRLQ